jgi:hypothetical protein
MLRFSFSADWLFSLYPSTLTLSADWLFSLYPCTLTLCAVGFFFSCVQQQAAGQ